MKKILLLAGYALTAFFTPVFFTPALFAQNCTQVIEGNDQLQYNLKEIVVPKGCKSMKLTLKHVGKAPKVAMGHNWVLANTKDINSIVQEGLKAGAKKDYLNAANSKIYAHTKMLGGGESDTITIDLTKLKKGGDYTFVCTFPGHAPLMRGKFKY